MSDKKDKLIALLEEIQKIFPHLDRVMITDLEDPKSIIFTTDDNIKEIAEEYDLGDDYLDSITEEIEKDYDFSDDDDDDDRGPLQ